MSWEHYIYFDTQIIAIVLSPIRYFLSHISLFCLQIIISLHAHFIFIVAHSIIWCTHYICLVLPLSLFGSHIIVSGENIWIFCGLFSICLFFFFLLLIISLLGTHTLSLCGHIYIILCTFYYYLLFASYYLVHCINYLVRSL